MDRRSMVRMKMRTLGKRWSVDGEKVAGKEEVY